MNRPSVAIRIPELDHKASQAHGSEGAVRHLDQSGLAERWQVSVRTLERWRWQKRGPKYIKVGSRVRYRIEDVENFERSHEHLADAAVISR
jgi:hypothetical protein